MVWQGGRASPCDTRSRRAPVPHNRQPASIDSDNAAHPGRGLNRDLCHLCVRVAHGVGDVVRTRHAVRALCEVRVPVVATACWRWGPRGGAHGAGFGKAGSSPWLFPAIAHHFPALARAVRTEEHAHLASWQHGQRPNRSIGGASGLAPPEALCPDAISRWASSCESSRCRAQHQNIEPRTCLTFAVQLRCDNHTLADRSTAPASTPTHGRSPCRSNQFPSDDFLGKTRSPQDRCRGQKQRAKGHGIDREEAQHAASSCLPFRCRGWNGPASFWIAYHPLDPVAGSRRAVRGTPAREMRARGEKLTQEGGYIHLLSLFVFIAAGSVHTVRPRTREFGGMSSNYQPDRNVFSKQQWQ